MELFDLVENFNVSMARTSLEKKGFNIKSLEDNELFDLWVRQVSGIKIRHKVSECKDYFTNVGVVESMAMKSSLRAIEDAGIDRNQIDTVIFATFTPSKLIPNPAVTLSHLLKLKNVGGFTLNSACSGFVDALGIALAKIKSGQSKMILVVASEFLSKNVDLKDPTTAILFGDGSGAAIVKQENSGRGMLEYISLHNYSANHITMQNGDYLKMEGGPAIQKQAVLAMYKSLNEVLKMSNIRIEYIDLIIPHQANVRILKKLIEKFGLNPNKVVVSIDKIANISAATIPVTLDMIRRQLLEYSYRKNNTLVGLTSVGGGYTSSALLTYL